MAKFVLLRIRSISTCKVQLVWWGRSTLCSWVRDRHFGKLSCDQKNDRSFPLVRWTTNGSSRHNQSESLLQVNTCSDKRLLLVVTLPVWLIYCFIFYDWLNLYLWTLTALLAFSKARIFVKDWELYKEFDWKARSVGLTVPFLIKYHFYNSKQRVGRVQWTSCELQLLLL